MVTKNYRFVFLAGFLVLSVLFSLNFVVAGFEDCWVNTGDETACDLASGCIWESAEEDPWCNDDVGCCLEESCWIYEGNE